MSPSPFAVSSPTDPASYSWEATDEGVAERFGIPRVAGAALRPQHVARPAGAGRRAPRRRPLRDDPLRVPAGRLPQPRRGRPPPPTASRPTSSSRAPARTRSSTCAPRPSCPPARRAVVSVPTYPMYRIHAEQRGGRVIAVPRLGRDEGWAMDLPAVREAARGATLVWICNPNNPTGRLEPDGADRAAARRRRGRRRRGRAPRARGRRRRGVQRVHRASVIALRDRYPNVVAVRTASKAYALAGLRVGFAIAAPDTLRADRALPPARLDQHRVGDGRRRGAARRAGHARERRARRAGAAAAHRRRSPRPASGPSRRSPTSCSWTS